MQVLSVLIEKRYGCLRLVGFRGIAPWTENPDGLKGAGSIVQGMAEIRRKQDEDRNFAYVVLHNGMDKLLKEIDQFCKGEYGRKCDLYKAFIARKDPSNYPATVHEFDEVSADLFDTVENHLRKARDFIKFEFSSEDGDFSLDIVPATQTDYLASRMHADDFEALDDSDTVVVAEMEGDRTVDEVRQFLEHL